MSRTLSITDLDLQGKKVLMRVDFNVPMDKKGRITDDTRILATLPSIKYVLEHGATLVLMSHLGRPQGKKMDEFSLAPVAKKLSEALHQPVLFAPDCVGPETEKMVRTLKSGQVLLLENLRFHSAEEEPQKDPSFTKQLASLGDVYINDAFGTAHRPHASTAEIAKYFPNKAVAGFLLEKEIRFLGDVFAHPKHPFCAIIGGAKVSSKIGVLKALLTKVDKLLIGGAMAYTFLKAQGFAVGDSLVEEDQLKEALELTKACELKGIKLFLPSDHVIADQLEHPKEIKIVEKRAGIPAGFKGVDIGPKTIQEYKKALSDAVLIFWNGPLGIFEMAPFAKGTEAIALEVAASPATKIVGGGDSIAALHTLGLTEKITHVSTGGGATLEYIEFGTLPGIEALSILERS